MKKIIQRISYIICCTFILWGFSKNVEAAQQLSKEYVKQKISDYLDSKVSPDSYYSQWISTGKDKVFNAIDYWIGDIKKDSSQVSEGNNGEYRYPKYFPSVPGDIYIRDDLEENEGKTLFHEVSHAVRHKAAVAEDFNYNDVGKNDDDFIYYMTETLDRFPTLSLVEDWLEKGDVPNAWDQWSKWSGVQYNIIESFASEGMSLQELNKYWGFDVKPNTLFDHYYNGDAYGVKLTPEPVSSILFVSGAATLFVFRRKRFLKKA